jgi:GNAT superfamily N-acetyltransferase
MSQEATVIRFSEARRKKGPRSRSGRFSTREVYQGRGAPRLERASPSGRLLRFEPRLEKDTEGLASEYSLRLAPKNIARIRLTRSDETHTWIDWVFVPTDYRGTGVAGRILREVIADADAEGVEIGLEARACAGLEQAALESWYGRFGFVVTGEHGTFGPILRRAPASSFRMAA